MLANQKNQNKKRGFMQRLRRDTSGNTMVIMAAALIPLIGIIGGGVDISRGYMVRTRLQQACDAGVLAGRRAAGNQIFGSGEAGDSGFDAQVRADDVFTFNFPSGFQGVTASNFAASGNANGTVSATATAVLPNLIMDFFGVQSSHITVNCNALLTISNTDVTMVLDTTGSMACPEDSDFTACGNYLASFGVVEGADGTTSRLQALRDAMTGFYDELEEASRNSLARIRYGFVPYSGTVNVGELLYDENRDWIVGGTGANTHRYQTRENVSEVTTVTSEIDDGVSFFALFSRSECNKFANNEESEYISIGPSGNFFETFTPSPAGNPVTSGGMTITYSLDNFVSLILLGSEEFGFCFRTTTTESFRQQFNVLDLEVFDYVQSIKPSNPEVPIPSDIPVNPATSRWAGCIEERETIPQTAFGYNSGTGQITPAGALDLDIDMIPNSDASRWKPYWPEVSYFRFVIGSIPTGPTDRGFKTQDACPQKAQLLSELTRAELINYADSMFPDGGTYHDVGAIWGARLSSPDGIFATNVNEPAPNNGLVGRHIVYLTDGELGTGRLYYSAYGLERDDQRVTTDGLTATQRANHQTRFDIMCTAIKGKGIRMWVIAFGTGLSPELTTCASADSAFDASDAASLNTAFRSIASSIADLRLSE